MRSILQGVVIQDLHPGGAEKRNQAQLCYRHLSPFSLRKQQEIKKDGDHSQHDHVSPAIFDLEDTIHIFRPAPKNSRDRIPGVLLSDVAQAKERQDIAGRPTVSTTWQRRPPLLDLSTDGRGGAK